MDLKSENESESAELLGQVVHSYNNHLAAIMGFLELAMLEESHSNYHSKSLESCNRALEFSQEVLASASRLQVTMQDIPLERLLTELKNITDLNIENKVSQSEDRVFIKTDCKWFISCFELLVEFVHAVNKMQVELVISIETSSSLNSLKLVLDSKYLDLNDEQNRLLFQPFYSPKIASVKKGIGLAKVKGFFQQMGAKISYQNSIGFIIRIPLK